MAPKCIPEEGCGARVHQKYNISRRHLKRQDVGLFPLYDQGGAGGRAVAVSDGGCGDVHFGFQEAPTWEWWASVVHVPQGRKLERGRRVC